MAFNEMRFSSLGAAVKVVLGLTKIRKAISGAVVDDLLESVGQVIKGSDAWDAQHKTEAFQFSSPHTSVIILMDAAADRVSEQVMEELSL